MIPRDVIATACLIWYFTVLLVCALGVLQIRKNTLKAPALSTSTTLPLESTPHVTVIRPVQGVEPYLYECLAATFHQTYARERLTVYFCVSSSRDPAVPILEQLLSDYHDFDAKLLLEEEDPNLSGRNGKISNLGPNPKIRNMSRAYREAKGDIIWIVDCNVWVSPHAAARMVDLLCGFTPSGKGDTSGSSQKYKFVHQLPLVVDISSNSASQLKSIPSSDPPADPLATTFGGVPLSLTGGLLEELFLSSSHAKFYTAIATVAIAPCTVGKSNMFRRSHLNTLTKTPSASPSAESLSEMRDPGIDFFSDNICEDHLIGDLLWRSPVPEVIQRAAEREGQFLHGRESKDRAYSEVEVTSQEPNSRWRNHGLLAPHPSNLATQPMARMPIVSYIDRRVRWLRVRKFTVTAATLVEPGTESLLCSAYGAWGFTALPWFHETLHIPQNWSAFCMIYLVNILFWALMDRYTWTLLQYRGTDTSGDDRPSFGRVKGKRRGVSGWTSAWLVRELLAFPIWIWAVVGGVTVVWRGRKFWVGMDMKVHEIEGRGRDERGEKVE